MKLPRQAFGVSLHPLLVHFPVAFLLAVPALDAAAVYAGPEPWWTLALYATIAGVLLGWAAIVTGMLEYLDPSVAGVDIRLAARHGVRTSVAWYIFAVKCLLVLIFSPVTLWLMVACLGLDLLGTLLLLQGIYLGVRQVYDQLKDDA